MTAEDGFDDDPRVRDGLDHLQRAARELIAASRTFLDVAEELVDDPGAARGLVDLLGSLGAVAARRGTAGPVSADDDDGDGEPPVQRIPVS